MEILWKTEIFLEGSGVRKVVAIRSHPMYKSYYKKAQTLMENVLKKVAFKVSSNI